MGWDRKNCIYGAPYSGTPPPLPSSVVFTTCCGVIFTLVVYLHSSPLPSLSAQALLHVVVVL